MPRPEAREAPSAIAPIVEPKPDPIPAAPVPPETPKPAPARRPRPRPCPSRGRAPPSSTPSRPRRDAAVAHATGTTARPEHPDRGPAPDTAGRAGRDARGGPVRPVVGRDPEGGRHGLLEGSLSRRQRPLHLTREARPTPGGAEDPLGVLPVGRGGPPAQGEADDRRRLGGHRPRDRRDQGAEPEILVRGIPPQPRGGHGQGRGEAGAAQGAGDPRRDARERSAAAPRRSAT